MSETRQYASRAPSTASVFRAALSVFLLQHLILPIAAYSFGSQPYNVTLESASPMLYYSPNALTNGTGGWNVTYSGSPWSIVGAPAFDPTLTSAPVGNGTSTQWTNTTGGSVSFSFFGTGFAVLGRLYNGRTELNIDGMVISTTASVSSATATQTVAEPIATSAPGPSTGSPAYDTRPILGQASGLQMGWHSINLTFYGADGGGPTGMEIYGARLVMVNGQNGAAEHNATAEAVSNNRGSLSLDFGWIWSGPWSLYDYPGNISSTQAYTSSAGAITAVTVPANTSIVLIIGSIVPPGATYSILSELDADIYTVDATGNPAYTSDDASETQEYQHMLNYTFRTDFIAQNQVLYAMQWMTGYSGQVLVSTQQGNYLGGLGIDSAVFIAADGNPTTPPNNTSPSTSSFAGATNRAPAIAGGVVGGVVGLALIGALLWFLCVRRKRKEPQPLQPLSYEEGKFDIDPAPSPSSASAPPLHSTNVSPYVALLPSEPHETPPGTSPLQTPINEKASLARSGPRTAQIPGLTLLQTSALPGQRSPTPGDTSTNSPATGSVYEHSRLLPLTGDATGHRQSPVSPAHTQPGEDDAAFRHKWEVLNEIQGQEGAARSAAAGDQTGHENVAVSTRGPTPVPQTHGPGEEHAYRFEEDAGRVEDTDVLPPNYNPAWRDQ